MTQITYREAQAKLRFYKSQGYVILVPLNARYQDLMNEIQRIEGILNLKSSNGVFTEDLKEDLKEDSEVSLTISDTPSVDKEYEIVQNTVYFLAGSIRYEDYKPLIEVYLGRELTSQEFCELSNTWQQYSYLNYRGNREITNKVIDKVQDRVRYFVSNPPKIVKQYPSIDVIECASPNIAVLSIKGEARYIPVMFDPQEKQGCSHRREVSVTHCSDESVYTTETCKIEIWSDDGTYKAQAVTSLSGKLEWLYPSVDTQYYSIRGQVSPDKPDYRDILVESTLHSHMVVASDMVACHVWEKNGQAVYSPFYPTLSRSGDLWYITSSDKYKVEWTDVLQNIKCYKYHVGDIVGIVDHADTENINRWVIDRIYWVGVVKMASLTALQGNGVRKCITAQKPLLQLMSM